MKLITANLTIVVLLAALFISQLALAFLHAELGETIFAFMHFGVSLFALAAAIYIARNT